MKTIKSGFSAWIMRSTKAVVLRSEQEGIWFGNTSRQDVVLPSAKCISATCSILNSPFFLNRSSFFSPNTDFGTKKQREKTTTPKKWEGEIRGVLFFAIVVIYLKSANPMPSALSSSYRYRESESSPSLACSVELKCASQSHIQDKESFTYWSSSY